MRKNCSETRENGAKMERACTGKTTVQESARKHKAVPDTQEGKKSYVNGWKKVPH